MTRDFRFDLLKALAIGMVVLGHVTSTHELSPHGSGMMGDFIVGLVTIAGGVFVTCPIFLLRSNRWMHALAEFGTTTMGVYFLHQGIIQHFIVPHYAGSCLSMGTLIFIAIVLWLACHIIVDYFNRHDLLRKVFN